MKNISRTIFAIVLSLCAISCHKHEDPAPEVEQHDFNTFVDGGAYYYGPYNGEFNMFCAYFLTGSTRVDDAVISGVGTALWLDMNVEFNSDNTIASTVYGPARDDASSVNAFLKGSENPHGSNIPAGSYIYYHPLSGAAVYKCISNGQVTFSNLDNGKYRVYAEVIADGEKYTFDFVGYFSYTDIVPEPDPSTDAQWAKADVTKLGTLDMGDWNSQLPSDYCDWKIRIAEKNFDFEKFSGGAEIEFEIITAGTATDFTGSYSVLTQELKTLDDYLTALKPGSALCGYFETVVDNNDEEINYYYGTWLFPAEGTYLGATKGTVEITKSNGVYTVKYDLEDEFTENAKFSGTYTGTITEVKSSGAPAKRSSSTSMAKARINTTVNRIAITAAK